MNNETGPGHFKERETNCTSLQANEFARAQVQHETQDWTRLCLGFVREAWRLPSCFPTAISAWRNSSHKHEWTGDTNDVPYGAPFFFEREDDPNSAGHVMLTGGHYAGRVEPKGVRIFRSTDIKGLGEVWPTTVRMIEEKWGLKPLGWTHDLNNFWLPLPPAPNKR